VASETIESIKVDAEKGASLTATSAVRQTVIEGVKETAIWTIEEAVATETLLALKISIIHHRAALAAALTTGEVVVLVMDRGAVLVINLEAVHLLAQTASETKGNMMPLQVGDLTVLMPKGEEVVMLVCKEETSKLLN